MSRRWWWVLGGLVAAAHVALLFAVAGERVLPKRRHVPPPNFGYAEGEVVDEATGERVVVRQFTVSTKLAGGDAPDGEGTTANGESDERIVESNPE